MAAQESDYATNIGPSGKVDLLACAICANLYVTPKALPCLHTFCEHCIREYIHSRAYDTCGRFPCPTCQRHVIIPRGGVEQFPDNFHISRIQELCHQSAASQQAGEALEGISLSPEQTGSIDRATRATSRTKRAVSLPSGELCFGSYGAEMDEFMKPVGLTVSCSDLIFVSDHHGNRIMIFDFNGCIKQVFTCKHSVNDIVASDNDTVFVANSQPGHPLVVEYNRTGVCLSTYGRCNGFSSANGIALLRNPLQIAAVSHETSTLYVLNGTDGKMVQKHSSRSVVGQPYNLAVNSKTEIIISDNLNNIIKIFSRHGKLLSKSSKTGELSGPLGLCLDHDDNIIIADSGNHQVKQFSATGKFRRVIINLSDAMTMSASGILRPCNVALSRCADKLVVLVTGSCFAEIRIYPYLVNSLSPTMGPFCGMLV